MWMWSGKNEKMERENRQKSWDDNYGQQHVVVDVVNRSTIIISIYVQIKFILYVTNVEKSDMIKQNYHRIISW